MRYPIVIEPGTDATAFGVIVPDLPGCFSAGDSLDEAVLGAGTVLVPLAGGALADLTGDLRVPYWLAASAMLVAVAIEELVYRKRSKS